MFVVTAAETGILIRCFRQCKKERKLTAQKLLQGFGQKTVKIQSMLEHGYPEGLEAWDSQKNVYLRVSRWISRGFQLVALIKILSKPDIRPLLGSRDQDL